MGSESSAVRVPIRKSEPCAKRVLGRRSEPTLLRVPWLMSAHSEQERKRMSNLEDIHKILDAAEGDLASAASEVLVGSRYVSLYVIRIGLENIQSRRRRQRRRELTQEIQPQYQPARSGITGRVELTPAAKKRIAARARDLFGPDGWNIGGLNLGEFTKEQLIAQAASERRSAKGSLRNAEFYEALAEPLKPGQLVKDHWKEPSAMHKVKDKVWKDSDKGRRLGR